MAINLSGANQLITVEAERALAELKDWERKKFPYVLRVALNNTAFDVMDFYKKKLPSILDNPTPYTINSMYVKKATRQDMSAEIGFKEWASKGLPAVKYLHHLNVGGERPAKRSEILLRSKGLIRSNQYLIPAKKYRNKYGNIRGGQMQKMLSSMQATFDTATYSKGEKRKQFFINRVDKHKHFGPHIYRRISNKRMRLFMWVVDKPHYTEILDYEVLTTERAIKMFPGFIDKAIARVRQFTD